MTHEEKINCMRIATGICNYGFDTKGLDLMVSLYELILEKKGDTDLKSIVTVESQVLLRDELLKKSKLLDKVPTKQK